MPIRVNNVAEQQLYDLMNSVRYVRLVHRRTLGSRALTRWLVTKQLYWRVVYWWKGIP